MIDLLKAGGYELPPRETDLSTLTTKDVFDKINEFMLSCNPKYEELVFDFWQLIVSYPISMCKRRMSDTLKLLINLFYHYKMPNLTFADKNENELWQSVRQKFGDQSFYSYEQLGILFMRSKASIHEAIKEKEAEVKQLIEEVNTRRHARSIALQELVAEEKLKLLEKTSKGIEKTNEQTPYT